ncbi:MAG: indole-3-glycerol phosphate synthase TrpC [Candidatus Marinimicrobia bacterium]|nr:indole-3-glycerol phosphate synthase TrpC [Candidatus Neomarinimicrobiota bacterium]
MTILEQIIEHKRSEVDRARQARPLESFAPRSLEVRDFHAALSAPGLQIIAEVKRRSPSGGDLSPDLNPAELARTYEASGAAAISVLTDEKYFGGSLDDLRTVRDAVSLPVLRKDFIIDSYQVYESSHGGADAMLLIADVLEMSDLGRLCELCEKLGMQALVEGYSDAALAKIQALRPPISGINARDLVTMDLDLAGMLTRRHLLPEAGLHVAESGITAPEEAAAVSQAGFQAALIGTALVTSGSPGPRLKQFLAAANGGA